MSHFSRLKCAGAAMAGMDDIRAQLASLLGKPRDSIGQVRKTDETPPRVSVIDVAAIITGHNVRYAAQAIRNIYEKYPDLDEKNIQVKFAERKLCFPSGACWAKLLLKKK